MSERIKLDYLERKIAELNKEYGDLGAYKEYGELLQQLVAIIKDHDTSPDDVKKLRKEIRNQQDRISLLEKDLKQAGKYKPLDLSLNDIGKISSEIFLISGNLYIQLGTFGNFYENTGIESARQSPFNSVSVKVSDKKKMIYLNTETILDRKEDGFLGFEKRIYMPGVCQRWLEGGNYTVSATVRGEFQSRDVTVDGDTKLYVHFDKTFKNFFT
jgi:hypothetical protein